MQAGMPVSNLLAQSVQSYCRSNECMHVLLIQKHKWPYGEDLQYAAGLMSEVYGLLGFWDVALRFPGDSSDVSELNTQDICFRLHICPAWHGFKKMYVGGRLQYL